jgi:hypothetical protein
VLHAGRGGVRLLEDGADRVEPQSGRLRHLRELATYALFDIVNRQLAGTDVRFFALNGGNDLSGIFMSTAQAEKARRALPRERDWPYLPVPEPSGFGEPWDRRTHPGPSVPCAPPAPAIATWTRGSRARARSPFAYRAIYIASYAKVFTAAAAAAAAVQAAG